MGASCQPRHHGDCQQSSASLSHNMYLGIVISGRNVTLMAVNYPERLLARQYESEGFCKVAFGVIRSGAPTVRGLVEAGLN